MSSCIAIVFENKRLSGIKYKWFKRIRTNLITRTWLGLGLGFTEIISGPNPSFSRKSSGHGSARLAGAAGAEGPGSARRAAPAAASEGRASPELGKMQRDRRGGGAGKETSRRRGSGEMDPKGKPWSPEAIPSPPMMARVGGGGSP
jgi:hypothetical protein